MSTHSLGRLLATLLLSIGAAGLTQGCSSSRHQPNQPGAGRTTGPAPISPASTFATSPSIPDLQAAAWKTPVDGAVYAQPVIAGTRVFVATEEDNVYALDLSTGRVLWRVSIGRPLTDVSRYAGCGDIDPLGITSTPAVDPAHGVLYVVGEVSNGASPPAVHRELVGVDMASGRIVRTADADPSGGGDDQIDLQQRAGLVIDRGRVDVGFGGLFGDCGYYHGWVVGVSTTAGVGNVQFDVTPGGSGGAIWQSGAPPSVDAAGNLYVVTGNHNSQGANGAPNTSGAPLYDSVIKLSPALTLEASARDTTAVDDEDFGTGNALLLPNGTLFAVGKTDIGYLLRQSDLGVVARIPGVCGSDPDGRLAFDPGTDAAYVPCRAGGIQEVSLATDRLGWKAGTVNSSPILAAGLLWAESYPGGTIQALNPSTGAIVESTPVDRPANTPATLVPTFATPAYSDGRLVIATSVGTAAAATVEAFG